LGIIHHSSVARGGYSHATVVPPRYQLAPHDLSTPIIKAWKRDISQKNTQADAAIRLLAVRAGPQ
jgi:hypothetical protein